MNKLMDRALEKVRHWSVAQQETAAEMLLALDELGVETVEVDDATLAAIDEALAETARGEKADPHDVEEFFARFRA